MKKSLTSYIISLKYSKFEHLTDEKNIYTFSKTNSFVTRKSFGVYLVPFLSIRKYEYIGKKLYKYETNVISLDSCVMGNVVALQFFA